MKKLIDKKGYTITVTSWENDGDNYATKSMTVDTETEARKIYKICTELFDDVCNNERAIGNSIGNDYVYRIEEYIEDNPEMGISISYIEKLRDNLLGYSDVFDYRVCEDADITYLEEDIWAQLIVMS